MYIILFGNESHCMSRYRDILSTYLNRNSFKYEIFAYKNMIEVVNFIQKNSINILLLLICVEGNKEKMINTGLCLAKLRVGTVVFFSSDNNIVFDVRINGKYRVLNMQPSLIELSYLFNDCYYRVGKQTKKMICIGNTREMHYLNCEQILSMIKQGQYILVKTIDGRTYKAILTIKAILRRISKCDFVLINSGEIVHIKHIKSISGLCIELIDGSVHSISRLRRAEIYEAINQYNFQHKLSI